MTTEVEDKGALRTLPFLDIVTSGGSCCERIFCRMDSNGPDGFLVMRQCNHRLARGKVPQSGV